MTLRVLVLLSVLPWVAHSLPGQSLVDALPENVVAYGRMESPWKLFRSSVADQTLFKAPDSLLEAFDENVGEMLDAANGFLGFEDGSLSAWVQSVTALEVALFRLDLVDGGPDMDFVAALHTPLAASMYEQVTVWLEEQAMAERDEETGETRLVAFESMDLLIGHREGMIILASSQSRLRGTLEALRGQQASGLKKSERFRAALGDVEGDTLCYIRVGDIIRMVTDGLPRLARWPLAFARQLGLGTLQDFGFRETREGGTRVALTTSAPAPAFELLAAPATSPDLLKQLPVETLLAVSFAGSLSDLWERSKTRLLDPRRFGFALLLKDRAREVQEMLGLELDQATALFGPGMVIGTLAASLEDVATAWFAVGELAKPAEGWELVRQAQARITERSGGELVVEQVGEWTICTGGVGVPAAACSGGRVVVGVGDAVKRVVAALQDDQPGLGRLPAFRQATAPGGAHVWIGLGALNRQGSMFKGDAGILVAADFGPKGMTLTARQSVAQGLMMIPMLLLGVSEAETVPPRAPGSGKKRK